LSAIKKHLHLRKDFLVLFIFSDCAFGAEEMESVFLAKSLVNFYVALKIDSRKARLPMLISLNLIAKCATKKVPLTTLSKLTARDSTTRSHKLAIQ
jgi:hypothetical protein